ncbi:hypothetical protein FGIG_03024 [Fasciola gigantica]|uniref:Uncharacterized protein n=1 Tax=Fasciola gigantica TaxID=46835 RepID=A0A504YVR2_FASGI|nr:hypothetical protein FGIG_03024 [Fasciola gigantica]
MSAESLVSLGFSIKHGYWPKKGYHMRNSLNYNEGRYGCSAILTGPVEIKLPHNIKFDGQFGFCYWKVNSLIDMKGIGIRLQLPQVRNQR